MKVFLTGALGNVGAITLQKLLEKDYNVVCFDIKTKQNEKTWKRMSKTQSFKMVWGDITDLESVSNAMDSVDCIIHVAAILPPISEKHPELAKNVNINGTKNIIKAAENLPKKPKIIFVSSISVHGRRMHLEPPVKANDPFNPVNIYTTTKVEAEKVIRESGLPWTIIRLGGVLPLSSDLKSMPEMFETPYQQRMEFIHVEDVATALVNAVEANVNEKVLLLGGGEDFQYKSGEFYQRMLGIFGIKELPESAFKPARPPEKHPDDWYFIDWMDTDEAQKLLDFQNHTMEDYFNDLKDYIGGLRYLAKLFSPLVYRYLLKKSPYYKKK